MHRSETSEKATRTQKAIELESVKRQTSTPAYLAQIGILLLNGNVGPQSNKCGAERLPTSRWAIFHIQLHESAWYQSNVWMLGARLHHHRGNWVLFLNAKQMLQSEKRDLILYAIFDTFQNKNCLHTYGTNIPCNEYHAVISHELQGDVEQNKYLVPSFSLW